MTMRYTTCALGYERSCLQSEAQLERKEKKTAAGFSLDHSRQEQKSTTAWSERHGLRVGQTLRLGPREV